MSNQNNKIEIHSSLFLFILLGLFLSSCNNENKGKNIPDVSKIKIDFNINRFDQMLMDFDQRNPTGYFDSLVKQFPDVTFQLSDRLRDPQSKETDTENILLAFAQAPVPRLVYDTCKVVYPNMKNEEETFSKAFQYYKYYFPKRKTPKVVTYLSEYSLGNFTIGDSIIGVGLDFYLGENHIAYPSIFPNYIIRFLNKDHICTKSIEALATELVTQPKEKRLLDEMIYNGKILYIVDALMPMAQDSAKFTFSEAQMKWCNENEAQIWAYFLEQKLVFSTDVHKYRKLVDYSPHSPGMPAEAPGRTASFIGYKIIAQFMEKNPSLKLEDLAKMTDAQAILTKSKYKPAR